MKVVVATCFKSNEERANCIGDVFKRRGDNIEKITTTFDHIKKKNRTDFNKDYHYLPTKKYKKNISITRLISHDQFATDLFFMMEDLKPDLIWLIVPANSLIQKANKYKKKYPNVKLIIDIVDMWPESLPVTFNKDFFPFKIWKNRRSNFISCADALVTECDYYKNLLEKEYKNSITTIHWSRDEDVFRSFLELPEDKISLCYLGSINNIIDIDKIVEIIKSLDKKVELHVIGDGENKTTFIKKISEVCRIIDHGEQRDSIIKANILKHCHAGLNIYKDNLSIGLTVKSIDYLQYGLPIINNIKGDTAKLIDEYNVGFNVDKKQISSKEIIEMRTNNEHIFKLYKTLFTKNVFSESCDKVIESVLK